MNRSEFERKSDQISSQLEDIRGRLGDITSSYQSLISRGRDQLDTATSQARSKVADARSGLGDLNMPVNLQNKMPSMPMGMQWWMPLVAIAAVILAVMIGRRMFAADSIDDVNQFVNETASSLRDGPSSGNQSRWT